MPRYTGKTNRPVIIPLFFSDWANGMKRKGESPEKSKKVVLVASDAVSGDGDEALPQMAMAKHIGLLPVLCSARTTDARVANPSHLMGRFSGSHVQSVHGFGTDNAVVVPLITHFYNPLREPKKKPLRAGTVATVLYADAMLEDTELFVAAKNVADQVAEETTWLASGSRSSRIVALPVLLPITTKRFLLPEGRTDPGRWKTLLDDLHRKTDAACLALDLSSDESMDGGATLFASRWARLVTLFLSEASEPAVFLRMCAMLGIPPDKSGLTACIWPMAMSAVVRPSAPHAKKPVEAVHPSRTTKWRMQHAHLPLWFLPVFLAATNDVLGNEVHDVHQAVMQIAGQLSILSSYASPAQHYAAAALDRLFATVQHVKADTALYLVNAAFSVGPVLDSIVRDRERIVALEAAAATMAAEKKKTDERISALETQIMSLLDVTEALLGNQISASTANK